MYTLINQFLRWFVLSALLKQRVSCRDYDVEQTVASLCHRNNVIIVDYVPRWRRTCGYWH